MTTKVSLTKQQYQVLDDAYKLFNSKLFNNELPDCMIVMHRKGKRNLGYFHPERFIDKEAYQTAAKKKKVPNEKILRADELSLNPDNFIGQSDTAILSTLVHEMVHVWQFHCTEKYPKNGYHDKIWGKKMEDIGLMPSNTGDENGKRTGQQMHHYIIRGGKFERVCIAFVKSHKIKLGSFPLSKASAASNKNKVKYSCPSCEANIWGKPNLHVECSDCGEQFVEV